MTEQETKSCPFCGETILSVAVKCKHCGSDLSRPQVAEQQAAEIEPQTASTQVIPPADYGIALLAIPVVSTLLIWLWIGQMALIHGPRAMLNMLVVVTVVGTAILVATEAKKAGMVSDRKSGIYSPTQWFFLMCFLWVITYPVYFFKRKKFGLPSQWVAALVVALVFMSSAATMGGAIDEQQAKLQKSLHAMKEDIQELDKLGQGLTKPDWQVEAADQQRLAAQPNENLLSSSEKTGTQSEQSVGAEIDEQVRQLVARKEAARVAEHPACADMFKQEELNPGDNDLQCANFEFKAADKELNAIYKLAMASLSDERKAVLKREQISWIKEKETFCEEAADRSLSMSSRFREAAASFCLADVTRKRTEYLRNFR